MAEQPLVDLPVFEDDPKPAPRPVRAAPRSMTRAPLAEAAPAERRQGFLASIDGYLIVVVTVLLAIGLMMVYSTTFDWSYQSYGSESVIFMQHVRNVIVGAV